jgi:GST-like protein
MDRRLAGRDFLAGDYSIADIACIGWIKLWQRQGQTLDDFPNVKRWLDTVLARPAVQRGLALKLEQPGSPDSGSPALRAALDRQKER